MQSWGTRSRFPNRDTELEPSKSGVIGLLCAALGRPRSEPVEDLAGLRFGVRVDNPGAVRRDFQTGAHIKRNAKGETTKSFSILSNRFYLAGASFVAALEGERAILQPLDAALRAPVWHLSLGRKSYVASSPVLIGLVDDPLYRALGEAALTDLGRQHVVRLSTPAVLRTVVDASGERGTQVRTDVPLSFAERTFTRRMVTVGLLAAPP